MDPGYPSRNSDCLQGWRAEEWGFDSRQGQKIILLSTESNPGAHPASYLIDMWFFFGGGGLKQPKREIFNWN